MPERTSKKLVGAWVADQPLLLDHDATVANFLNDYLHSRWMLRRQRLAHEIDSRASSVGSLKTGCVLTQIPYSDRPQLKINQLYWPAGASRYSEMYAVVPQASLQAILKEAWTLESVRTTGDRVIRQNRAEDLLRRTNTTVTLALRYPQLSIDIPMYVADYRILGGAERDPLTTKLAMIRLVDERFYWQQMGFGGQCTGRPATGPPTPTFPNREHSTTWWTWSDLITELLAGIHVTDYELSEIDGGYNYPDPVEFCRPFESIGLLLDAVAASIGRRISRDLDGTVRIHTPAEAWDHALALIEGYQDEWNRIAGGSYDHGPRFARLLVAFPRNLQGAIDCTSQKWFWTLVQNNLGHTDAYASHEVIDEACVTWSAMLNESIFGTPGVNEVVYSTMHAYWEDTTADCPDNWAAVKALAQLIFRDRALWNERWFHWELLDVGVTPRQPNAMEDYRLYNLVTEGRCEYELAIPPTPPLDPGDEPPPDTPPRLMSVHKKQLTTFMVALNTDQHPRHNLSQDPEPLLPSQAYFQMNEVLQVGSSAEADWVVWNDTSGQWESGEPVGVTCDIYDPYHRAFALIDEVVRCEWDCERQRWEVCEVRGLRRHAVVTEAGGITAGGSGEVTIYEDDVATDPAVTVTAELTWMDMAKDIDEDKEIAIWYNRDEERWIIDGTEC